MDVVRHVSHDKTSVSGYAMSTSEFREKEREENKDKRLNIILMAGMDLFLEQGLAEVNMKDVARKAAVSRATLYRYYSSKEDLALAIEHHLYLDVLVPKFSPGILNFSGNGYEKIENYLMTFIGIIEEHPEIFKLSGAMDHYFNYKQNPEDVARKMKTIFQDDPTVEFLKSALQEGMDDGSLKPGLNLRLTAYTIDQTIISLGQRIASRKEEMTLEFNLESPERMVVVFARTMLAGLKKDSL